MEEYQALFKKISQCNLKEMKPSELQNLSDQIRAYIIDTCSQNGGHLASNLGVVELTVALHRAFRFPEDKLLFDVGHQCYTHKVLSGRSLDHLRQEEGVDGFQKRNESAYDPFEAGHSSTSISTAMGMAVARDQSNENYQIVAFIGDSSIANGMALEALNNLEGFRHKIIIVINDNNMSISQPVGAFHNILQTIRLSPKYMSMKEKYRKRMNKNRFTRWFFSLSKKAKDLLKKVLLRENLFEMFGLHYIGGIDGYDFKEMESAFRKARKKKSSVVIHVTTIKGKGYNLSESENVSSWHSVQPFDIRTGKSLFRPDEDRIFIKDVYASKLDEELSSNPDMILINPSTMIGSGIDFLLKKYPDRVFDVGISEEHAVTFASGYALSGKHAYVSIYSTFLQRSYDQVNHDVARMNLPVTLLIDRAGLVGSDGETHQGIFDEAFLINMPNLSVCMAKNRSEAEALFDFSRAYPHPLAIRYSVETFPKKAEKKEEIVYGKWKYECRFPASGIAVIGFGPVLNTLLDAHPEVTVVNALFQSPLDKELLKELLSYRHIVVYDAYGIEEGFPFHINAALTELGYRNQIHFISLKNRFIQKGTIDQQQKRCKVDPDYVLAYLRTLN